MVDLPLAGRNINIFLLTTIMTSIWFNTGELTHYDNSLTLLVAWMTLPHTSGLSLPISHIAKCQKNSHVALRIGLLLATVAKAVIFASSTIDICSLHESTLLVYMIHGS